MMATGDDPLHVDDWLYRDEGHANIIIANKCSRDVLRLRKCELSSCVPNGEVLKGKKDVDTSKWQQQLDYQNLVMRPLIGPKFVPFAHLVQLPEGFVDAVNKACVASRPANRLNKAGDPSWQCGIHLPDVALLPISTTGVSSESHCSGTNGVRGDASVPCPPTFCIELKPKWGYLPISPHACGGNGIKYTHCRFCMFQHLKVAHGKWQHRSLYCPLDLFSGNSARRRHALYSILQTPQNNIRILKDARHVFKADSSTGMASAASWEQLREACSSLPEVISDEDNAYYDTLPEDFRQRCPKQVCTVLHILSQILHHDSKRSHHTLAESRCGTSLRTIPLCGAGTFDPAKHGGERHTGVNGVQSKLASEWTPDVAPCGGVLASVRLAQMLDDMDIEGILPLVHRLGALDPAIWEKWGLNGPYTSGDWQLSSELGRRCEDIDDGSVEFAVRKIRQFAAACTAKDCSIMVVFQQFQPGLFQAEDQLVEIQTSAGLQKYAYNISVVDLDIKEFQRVKKYIVEDSQVVSHFMTNCKVGE